MRAPSSQRRRYDNFQAVVNEAARARSREERLPAYAPEHLEIDESPEGRRTIEIDDTGDGNVDIQVPHPDFSRKDLRSTAVLRWEYRPGSTFHLVWSHDRSHFDPDGRFDLARDLDDLWGARGRNILAVKGTYRIEL